MLDPHLLNFLEDRGDEEDGFDRTVKTKRPFIILGQRWLKVNQGIDTIDQLWLATPHTLYYARLCATYG